jgi:hypothetical protein
VADRNAVRSGTDSRRPFGRHSPSEWLRGTRQTTPTYDFSFTITYTHGCSEYTDIFLEHGSLRSEAIYACLDPSEMWVLESLTSSHP